MDFKINKIDVIVGIIAVILAILSYIFYEQNIVVSIAILIAILLVYRRFWKTRGIKRRRRFRRFGDDDE